MTIFYRAFSRSQAPQTVPNERLSIQHCAQNINCNGYYFLSSNNLQSLLHKLKEKNKSCPHENGEWKYFPKRLLYTHSLRFNACTKKLKEANPS